MRFNHLAELIDFISTYNLEINEITQYKGHQFPNFSYLAEMFGNKINITIAVPAEKHSMTNDIKEKIHNKRQLHESNKQHKVWISTKQLKNDLEEIIQLPITILENKPTTQIPMPLPILPFKLNKAYTLTGIQYLSRWSFTIKIGPIDYKSYLNFMSYTWLHAQINTYMNNQFGMLWSYRWLLEINRITCPPLQLGDTTLGLNSWITK